MSADFQDRHRLRRVALVVGLAAVASVVVAAISGAFANGDSFSPPSEAALASLSLPQRIVTIAKSQIGYRSNPSDTYCNKFSAFWDAGVDSCPSGEKSEEWCADFAAWVWHKAGVAFVYGYGSDEISGAAVSFYEWGVANGQWHPAVAGYVATPGDIAVYGLDIESTDPSAAHVAIVTADQPGQTGPDVVNGDGDRTGYSVVETGTDQVQADADRGGATLDGYVSP